MGLVDDRAIAVDGRQPAAWGRTRERCRVQLRDRRLGACRGQRHLVKFGSQPAQLVAVNRQLARCASGGIVEIIGPQDGQHPHARDGRRDLEIEYVRASYAVACHACQEPF